MIVSLEPSPVNFRNPNNQNFILDQSILRTKQIVFSDMSSNIFKEGALKFHP